MKTKIGRWPLVFLGGVFALGSAYVYSQGTGPFTNMQKTVVCSPSQIFRPTSEVEVQAIVRQAAVDGLSVKAASPGWQGSNPSSCVARDGLQIDTSGLAQILAVDSERLEVKVQPGIKLWDFNKTLHREHQLALVAVQEYADVTLGGMLGNSTHGSSLGEASSSLQDRIVSARLVDGQGEVRVLSGKELDYLGGNMGVLGIITELTIQVQPSFKLQAHVGSQADTHLEDEVLGFASSHYSTAVTWFPGHQTYTTVAFEKVPNTTPGQARNGQAEKAWLERTLFPPVFKAANLAGDDKLLCFLEKQRMDMKSKSFFTEKFGKPVEPAVGWAHEMLSFVCRDRCPFNSIPYSLEEIAIPLERLPAFILRAKELFAQERVCLPLNGIYFRFGHAARGALAMAGGRETVYVGIEYVRNELGNKYVKGFEFIQELEHILLNEFDGRPHWGKNQASMFVDIREQYPRWDEFSAYRDQLDPKGLFKNEWFASLNGEASQKAPTKNCVAEQACYCQTDEHCPANFSCEPGLIAKDARVCRKR